LLNFAGVQKLTAAGGDLFWRMFQMLAKMAAEGGGKFVRRVIKSLPVLSTSYNADASANERCDVPSKEDHTTPVVLKRRSA
jgi:hypothetical protein